MSPRFITFIGVILSVVAGTMAYKAHVLTMFQEYKFQKVKQQATANLAKLAKSNVNLIENVNNLYNDKIMIGRVAYQFYNKYIAYGADIVPEVGYTQKKALYLSKGIGFNLDDLKKSYHLSLFLLVPNSDNLYCKNGTVIDLKDATDIISLLRKNGIDPVTFKDRVGNYYSIEDLKTKLGLSAIQTAVLQTLASTKCSIGNNLSSVGAQAYAFIPEKEISKITTAWYDIFSSKLVDVIDKNTNTKLGYLIKYGTYPEKITAGIDIYGNPITEDNLDTVCDAGFYLDEATLTCKPNIERNLVLYTYFDRMSLGKFPNYINKIGATIHVADQNKEYYSVRSPRNKGEWIDYGIYAYNGGLSSSFNINASTGYTISIWFVPKTDSSIIFETNNSALKLVNNAGKLQLTIQGKIIDLGNAYQNQLYNVLFSYDKYLNRIGVYLNGNAIIKSEKGNIEGQGYEKNINLGNAITFGSGNEYFMFKAWTEGFGDYLLRMIYSFENDPTQTFDGIPSPWFTRSYNGYTTCATNGLQTIQTSVGVGVLNCGEGLGLPGGSLNEQSFNTLMMAGQFKADKGSPILVPVDKDTNKLNINTLNYMTIFNNSTSNVSFDLPKALNTTLQTDLTGYNGYVFGFKIKNAIDGQITDGPISISKNNTTLIVNGENFSYTNNWNVIVVVSNKLSNKTEICILNNDGEDCKTINGVLNNGTLQFYNNGVIDNIFLKKYAVNIAVTPKIAEKVKTYVPNLTNYITSCSETTSNGLYYKKTTSGKLYTVYCYKDSSGNYYDLVYTSIYSKFDKTSAKFVNQWPTIRGNGSIDYYTDIVDVCRQFDLKPYYVKSDNVSWYNILTGFITNYTNYIQTKGNNGGIAIGLWYDQAKQGWYNLDNMSSNGLGAGTFNYKLGENLPDNMDGNSMDDTYRFASIWASSDNGFGPEDFNTGTTLAIICGGKEGEGLAAPIQIIDFNTNSNNLSTRKEYVYLFDGSNWNKTDFYACPVGKVYDRATDSCKEATDGNLVKIYSMDDAYKAGYNITPDNNNEWNKLDNDYITGDYLEGAYTGYDYDKIGGKDYSQLNNNNPYDPGNGDTLYAAKVEGQLCVPASKEYQFAVDGGGSIEFDINVDGTWYSSHKYGDDKAEKKQVNILNLNLKKGCYDVVFRFNASDQGEDNYVVWFNDGNGWDILGGNYLKMYKNTDYLNKDTTPVLNVTN